MLSDSRSMDWGLRFYLAPPFDSAQCDTFDSAQGDILVFRSG